MNDPEFVDVEKPNLGAPFSPRPSPLSGAKKGFRIASYLIGPIAFLVVTITLVPTAIGIGSGYGFALHREVFSGVIFYVTFAILGTFAGAISWLIVAPVSSRHTSTLDRPIRFFKRADPTAPQPRWRRWILWIWPALFAVPGILIVIAGLGFGIYSGIVTNRKLAEAISTAEQSSPNWQFNDLIAARATIPDEENSALVVASVSEQLPQAWPPAADVLQAYDQIGTTYDNVRLPDAVYKVLRAEMVELDESVQLARTIANYKRGRHELIIGPNLFDTPLGETQNCRAVARLLSVDAALRAQAGDIDGALESARAILGVARSIGDEPFIISGMVRIAISSVATNAMQRALAQGNASESTLARIQSDLNNALADSFFADEIRGERAQFAELLRRLRAGEMSVASLSSAEARNQPLATTAPWGQLWYDYQRAVGLTWMNELVRIAQQPVHARAPLLAELDAEISRTVANRYSALASTLAALLPPAFTAAFDADQRHRTEISSAIVAIAAERHRLKTGSWPATLDAIDRVILPKPPDDPSDGQALRLLKTDSSYRVYSIGRNLKDERGAYDVKKWGHRVLDDVGFTLYVPSERGKPATQ